MPQQNRRGPVRAVVFDFDGVIADTERLHLAAFQAVFAERGWTLDEAAYSDRYLGYDDEGLVDAYVADRGLTITTDDRKAIVHAKVDAFSRHLGSPEILYPSTRACVALLAERFPLAIASGALHHEIEAILQRAGLRHLFGPIVASDDVALSKPAPDPYLEAARLLGMPTEVCVAVEDSPAGLSAARRAGMRTIAITTTSPRHLLDEADRVIADLAELTPAAVMSLGAL
jgi:beta-phosphoglucomutase-like phosphatase (HAD superfamily)